MQSQKSQTNHWVSTNFEYLIFELWTVNQQCFLDSWAELRRNGGAGLTMKAAVCCYRITETWYSIFSELILEELCYRAWFYFIAVPLQSTKCTWGNAQCGSQMAQLDLLFFPKSEVAPAIGSLWMTLDHWMDGDATILHAHRREVLACFASGYPTRNWKWEVSWGDYPPYQACHKDLWHMGSKPIRTPPQDPASQLMGDMKVTKHCLQLFKLQRFCTTCCPINKYEILCYIVL